MQRNADAIDVHRRPKWQTLDQSFIPNPIAKHALPRSGAKIMPHSPTGMVGMSVRDHRTINGTPWIDVEISGWTENSRIGHPQ
jgi:hypothetical protein